MPSEPSSTKHAGYSRHALLSLFQKRRLPVASASRSERNDGGPESALNGAKSVCVVRFSSLCSVRGGTARSALPKPLPQSPPTNLRCVSTAAIEFHLFAFQFPRRR